jgi:phosphate transport system permease protein
LLWAVAILLAGIFAGLVGHLVLHGWPALSWSFLSAMPERAGRDGGILPMLLATAWLVGGALLLAAPVGVGAAVWLCEWGPPRLCGLLRSLLDALAGVPSIVFGLFGFSLFVVRLGWGWSIASGAATLALMILPTVVRTAEEALAALPRSLREGALALGATRWQTVRRVLLPAAAPGILTGLILGSGRALGETAALLLTAGSDSGLPASPLDPGRSLSVHLYILATEGLSGSRAYATALVLVAALLLVNLAAAWVGSRLKGDPA